VGLVRTDVATLGCDFLAGCGRKALRATEGTGFLFVRRELADFLEPALAGWWNGVYDRASGELSLVSGARRFEAGCPIVPSILGLGAALSYATAIGIEVIEARVRELTAYAVERLSWIPGFELYGPRDAARRIGIVPFNLRGVDPARIVSALEQQNCIIEAGSFMADPILERHGVSTMARVSLHYFNTHAEIHHLATLVSSAATQ
jgi:cysteine desulfurase / selenocysteine lyase